MSPPFSQHHRPEKLYFAFGSNLHLAQMAKRCPQSRFIGTAELHKYRFQINERGFANVLPSSKRGDYVEGLVYLLSQSDEASLDRSEGVPWAYRKGSLEVEVFTASIDHVGRAVPELAQHLLDSEQYPAQPQNSSQSTNLHGQLTKALVYLSPDYVTDSEPRDEYIDRMNAGIIDARKLGMSRFYIDTCLRPFIKYRDLPFQGNTSTRHRATGNSTSLNRKE